MHFFGETLRQAGVLILYSTLVIWSLVFLTGLGTCGIEAGYFNQSTGTATYAGVFAAWCNLREAVPYVFGYMMAARRSAPASWPSSARCASPRRSTRSR